MWSNWQMSAGSVRDRQGQLYFTTVISSAHLPGRAAPPAVIALFLCLMQPRKLVHLCCSTPGPLIRDQVRHSFAHKAAMRECVCLCVCAHACMCMCFYVPQRQSIQGSRLINSASVSAQQRQIALDHIPASTYSFFGLFFFSLLLISLQINHFHSHQHYAVIFFPLTLLFSEKLNDHYYT